VNENSGNSNNGSVPHNKYLLACAIAKRARYLSEKKGRELEESVNNPIFFAMNEIELGKLKYRARPAEGIQKEGGEVILNGAGMEDKP
jgi:DNA-directed RNA polymerase subunit K/omega